MTDRLDPAGVLARLATLRPHVDAVVDDHGRVDRAGLQARVRRADGWLAELGIGPGARFGLQLGNRTDTVALLLAAWSRGATPVNINRRYRAGEVCNLVRSHDLAALVTEQERLDELDEVVGDGRGLAGHAADGVTVVAPVRDHPVPETRVEYALLTGGTTGAPRLVAWTLHDIVLAAMYPRSHPDVSPDPDVLVRRSASGGERTLVAAPMDHAFGQWVTLAVLLGGGTAVLTDRRPLDPEHLLTLAGRERCDAMNVSGQAFAGRLVEALDGGATAPAQLRQLITGGAPTLDATKRALWQYLPELEIVEGIGSSETGTLGRATQHASMPGSLVPRFVPTSGTMVVTDDLSAAEPGRLGRLARAGLVSLGYVDDRPDNRFTVVDGRRMAVLDDAAGLEPDGTFLLHGRLDRVINTGGEKVHPDEVETVLARHPSVADCIVVGVPDETFGQRVVAVVKPAGPTFDEEIVRRFARSRLAGYKVPGRLVVVAGIPRLDSGKVDLAAARTIAIGDRGPNEQRP
jgi:3-oxocholest-4-en-26-oate---CoA ligase